MVGVPGRSKGCATCRKRKKKCDLREPICGNCTKGNFVCGGYQRDLIVVHVGAEGKQGSYRAPNSKPPQMVARLSVSPGGTELGKLNTSAFYIECSNTFWNTYLPRPGRKELFGCYSDPDHVMCRWAIWTQSKTVQSGMMQNAMLAVSASSIGSWRKDPVMTRRGIELYVKSLAQVSAALKKSKNSDPWEVIATCRLLALYETLNSAELSSGKWQGHVTGIAELVRLHPPETFAFDGLHELFLDVRLIATVAALAARKSTWLAESEWVNKPFVGQSKGTVNVLCDIVLHLPGILEDFDRITTAPINAETKRCAQALQDRCWMLDAQLQAWYQIQAVAIEPWIDPAHAKYIMTTVGFAPPEDLPDILAEYGLGTLYGMTLYWPACLILYGLLPELYQRFPSATGDAVDFGTLPRMDLLKYTRCIARSIKHFLTPGVGLSEAISVALPISCLCQSIYSASPGSPDVTTTGIIREIMNSLDGFDQTATNIWMKSLLMDLYKPGNTSVAASVVLLH